MRIPSGVTDQYIYFIAVDDTDYVTRETGLSSFTVYRSRNGAAAAAMTTPTINEVDSTNLPGVYELLLDEDMTIASGNDSEAMVFHITHAGMLPVTKEIELYRIKITAGNTLGVESDGDVTKVNELDGHTAQTGDSYARIGAPAGASVSADIATIDSNVDDILTDTGTTLPATLATATALQTVDDEIAALQSTADAIETDTQDLQTQIGTAGDGLTAVIGAESDTLETLSDQIDGIGSGAGGSLPFAAIEDNTGGAIDPSSAAFVGTVDSGTYDNVASNDGTSHTILDSSDDIDIVYGFQVGGGRVGTQVQIVANVNGNADEIKVKAYDHVGDDWEIIGTIEGSGGSSFVTIEPTLFQKYTGTGAEIGKVYIRFETDSTTPAQLEVDQCVVLAANLSQTVGYSGGYIYFDSNASNTNTEAFVDGVADNPVSSEAAVITLAGSTGLTRVDVTGDFVVPSSLESAGIVVMRSSRGTLDFSGEDVGGVEFVNFRDIFGTGTRTNSRRPAFDRCTLGKSALLTTPEFIAIDCEIGASGIALNTDGEIDMDHCSSGVGGLGATTVTLLGSGTTEVGITDYVRGLTIANITANETMTLNGDFNTLTLTGSSSATMNVSGMYGTVTGTASSGATLTNALQKSDVAAILADTNELQTDDVPGLIAALNDLDAAGIRAAVGMASADLDTQLDALPTAAENRAEMDSNSTQLAAIVADTNELQGDDIPGLIAALNDLSAAQVNAEVDTALADYDAPTKAELDAGLAALNDPTVGAIADAVWDEPRADHTTQGTYGESFGVMVSANAVTGTLSTTSFTTDLTEATDDHYIGRVVLFASGALAGQAAVISDYDGTSKLITVQDAMTDAPSNGDDFIIL